jgi:transcriptional regulator GlxA family with amidase domain
MTYYSREGSDATEPKRIGFIVVDGTSSFDLLGSVEAFAAARVAGTHGDAGPCYESVIIGVDGRSFVASSGAAIKAHHTIRNAPALDTIVIPGGVGLQNFEAAERIASWLTDRVKTTRRIAAISAGIYPLASAGLLNGRCVTTHWRLANDVARRFPAVSVGTAVSFVKADNFYTCGGGIAAMEMSLALIEEDYGRKTAVTVARELSIDLRPPGAGREIAQPEHQPGPAERLAELPAWMTSRLHRNLAVEVLAERAGLSPRHFYRLF